MLSIIFGGSKMKSKLSTSMALLVMISTILTSGVEAKKVETAEKIPVLAYHHIIKEDYIKKTHQENNQSTLSLEDFEKQMQYLYENKFYIASMDELEKFLDGKISLPKKTVVISFDDGYLSNRYQAYPILKRYKFNAELFMITSVLDHSKNTAYNEMKIQFLRTDDLKAMSDVFKYGSHTNDMHRGVENNLPLFVTSPREDVKKDLLKSREILKTRYFAYPSGCHNPDVIQELKNTGYTMAFTISPGYVTKTQDKYVLPRFNISYQKVGMKGFEDIVNGRAN